MELESITIVLPAPAKSLSPNATIGSIGGRFKKASATKRYRRLACDAVEAERVENAPWPMVLVCAEFFFKTNRRRDPDNAMASLKAVYDGIVDAGLVIDDDSKHMRRGESTFGVDTVFPRVVLTITKCKAIT